MIIIKLQKNLNAIALIVCSLLLLLSSCNSENHYEALTTESITKSDALSSEDLVAVSELLDSIEGLNAKYPSATTRGFWSGGVVGLADAAGWAAGRSIGGWAGGAIGSAGGPWGAVAGHLVGRRVGPYVCTFLASGAAGMLFKSCSTNSEQDLMHKKFELTYVISDEDSIGYYHNDMMVKIDNNRSMYEEGGTLNYDLLYQDIVNYLREKGKYEAVLDSPLVKSTIINQIKGICEISQKYKSEPLCERFVDEQCEYLKKRCNMTDTEVNLYKDFNVSLYKKCSTLSDERVTEYSIELNKIIKNSKVSESVKKNLERSADLTINSSLCWKKNL